MKIHYNGKYNLDPNTLPHKEYKENAVPFKEPKSSKSLAIIANVLSLVIIIVLAIPVIFRCHSYIFGFGPMYACLASLLTLFPHEFLHAICFKDDAYIYTNLKQGMLFVVGPESMTKGRFIFMSLLPNIVFGFIPFIIGLIFPELYYLSIFGLFCIGMGAGDYINVFNGLTQMPKGSKTYLYGFNSFWYMPEENED